MVQSELGARGFEVEARIDVLLLLSCSGDTLDVALPVSLQIGFNPSPPAQCTCHRRHSLVFSWE